MNRAKCRLAAYTLAVAMAFSSTAASWAETVERTLNLDPTDANTMSLQNINEGDTVQLHLANKYPVALVFQVLEPIEAGTAEQKWVVPPESIGHITFPYTQVLGPTLSYRVARPADMVDPVGPLQPGAPGKEIITPVEREPIIPGQRQ